MLGLHLRKDEQKMVGNFSVFSNPHNLRVLGGGVWGVGKGKKFTWKKENGKISDNTHHEKSPNY